MCKNFGVALTDYCGKILKSICIKIYNRKIKKIRAASARKKKRKN